MHYFMHSGLKHCNTRQKKNCQACLPEISNCWWLTGTEVQLPDLPFVGSARCVHGPRLGWWHSLFLCHSAFLRVLGSVWDRGEGQGTVWRLPDLQRTASQGDLCMLIKQTIIQKNVTCTKIWLSTLKINKFNLLRAGVNAEQNTHLPIKKHFGEVLQVFFSSFFLIY